MFLLKTKYDKLTSGESIEDFSSPISPWEPSEGNFLRADGGFAKGKADVGERKDGLGSSLDWWCWIFWWCCGGGAGGLRKVPPNWGCCCCGSGGGKVKWDSPIHRGTGGFLLLCG